MYKDVDKLLPIRKYTDTQYQLFGKSAMNTGFKKNLVLGKIVEEEEKEQQFKSCIYFNLKEPLPLLKDRSHSYQASPKDSRAKYAENVFNEVEVPMGSE